MKNHIHYIKSGAIQNSMEHLRSVRNSRFPCTIMETFSYNVRSSKNCQLTHPSVLEMRLHQDLQCVASQHDTCRFCAKKITGVLHQDKQLLIIFPFSLLENKLRLQNCTLKKDTQLQKILKPSCFNIPIHPYEESLSDTILR